MYDFQKKSALQKLHDKRHIRIHTSSLENGTETSKVRFKHGTQDIEIRVKGIIANTTKSNDHSFLEIKPVLR